MTLGTRVRLKIASMGGWRGCATLLSDDGWAIKDGSCESIVALPDQWAKMRDQTPNPEHAGMVAYVAAGGCPQASGVLHFMGDANNDRSQAAAKALNRIANKEGRGELDELIFRLRVIAPIVREQRVAADRKAEREYFESGEATDEERDMWQRHHMMSADTLCNIEYRDRLCTPEEREPHSIGLAVAAFGGSDAISDLGWMIGSTIWHEWDGMAGHWL
jgi:hypothetical protein